MRKDPSTALQTAIYAALTAAGLTHVYDIVPADTTLPWVVIGEDQVIADYDSLDINECHQTVHIYAASVRECKAIVARVRDTLDCRFGVPGYDTHEGAFDSCRYVVESDGRTSHAIVEFIYALTAIPPEEPSK